MDNNLQSALDAHEKGLFENWLHAFLVSDGKNKALSDGLRKQQRYWVGPIEIDLILLKRQGGPEEGMKYPEPQDAWDERINRMEADLASGWKPAPLIVEFKDGVLFVTDGGHRIDALQKSGYTKYWTAIWANTPQDHEALKTLIGLN